ncbi:MAG: FAD-dependent monooxygenase [Anaerolineales bacterium]|nr:FAD-dependent monooxygenase [Anaerolineales bacterium]
MLSETDILIVGAGPAGSTLAYFLASAGFSVRVLDKAQFPRDKTCGDGLSPRALHVLKNIGALEAVNAVAAVAADGSTIEQRPERAPRGEPQRPQLLRAHLAAQKSSRPRIGASPFSIR